jgi:HKD family nuclease
MSTNISDRINLKDLFTNAKEVWIAVALMQKDIAKQIIDTCHMSDNKSIHVIVGINLPTDPEAIELLYNSGCDIRVYSNKKTTYHPKVYVVKKSNGRYSSIIGSANATVSGFNLNVELSVSNNDKSFCESILDWISQIDKRYLRLVDTTFVEAYKKIFEDRKLANVNRQQEQILQRIQDLWNNVLEFDRRKLIDRLKEDLSKNKDDEIFKGRNEVVLKLREAMDVAHNFKDFNSDAYIQIAELGRIRRSQRSPFYEKETINAIAELYTAPEDCIANAIDNLCSIKNVGIGYASRVLCVREPKKYMVINGPVIKFLKRYGIQGISGKINGAKYLEICQSLAPLLDEIPDIIDFAHFDCLIWDEESE